VSNSDILPWTLNLYVSFWGVCSTLKPKLDTLESRLDQVRRASEAEMGGAGQAARSGFILPREKVGPALSQNQAQPTSGSGIRFGAAFPGPSTPANGQPVVQREPDSAIPDHVLNFNDGQGNIPDLSLGGDDLFENLGLELGELFTYPYQEHEPWLRGSHATIRYQKYFYLDSFPMTLENVAHVLK
jgi:hypothetical protein